MLDTVDENLEAPVVTTARAPRKRRVALLVIIGLAIIAIILIASLTRPGEPPAETAPTAPGTQQPPAADQNTPPTVPDLSRRIDGDVTALGPVNAPVVLIEYADYRCPYCGIFTQETLPKIVAEYVDSGQVRVEWRDIPIFGEDSFNAAAAARAAGAQGLFWEYNHAVYAHQGDSRKDLPRATLIELARQVGVADLAAFEASLTDPEILGAVAADAQEAQAIGVQSTPSFLVGQTPVMGAQPIEAFRQVIDAELARVSE
ncbi:hypothetical protein FM104_08305 [Microbacterium esteraromaticum]|uniref:Thioredoxin domain-containing protein n=1 Tax=Microbacterium esteraromaticum TaxID=57043 RepID=A0A1R4JN99_9MICO|nr:thioredoxin domain-containing protein [Microbacterium esteraromaticum]SJN33442.1 hypothetical protein FM104_08305 [Microbacterium esteraromaticum]